MDEEPIIVEHEMDEWGQFETVGVEFHHFTKKSMARTMAPQNCKLTSVLYNALVPDQMPLVWLERLDETEPRRNVQRKMFSLPMVRSIKSKRT